MCGFAGIFSSEGLIDSEKEQLENMSKAIRFRGPDEDSITFDENIAFAFRRLSIIDLSSGSQPQSENGGEIKGVFNGEIYNYRELRDTLENEQFSTNSELEVMLKLYKKHGTDFIPMLRGMFAIAFFDKKNGKILLARDRFGIKPLYYRKTENGITFASEAKAFIFDDGIKSFKTSDEIVQHYFSYQYMPTKTFSDGLSILPAGHFLVYDINEKKIELTRYFNPLYKADNNTSFEEKKKKLRDVLYESVKYHMISDVPVGTFLSSGIDSAVITAIASKLNPGIKAFTVAFGVKEYSEIDDASAIAKHLDVEHIKLICTVEDFKRAFEKVVWALDFPVADPSTVAIFLICEEASRHLKVVLSGEGADEIFGGYRIYDESRYSSKIYSLPTPVKAVLKWIANVLPECVKGKNFLIRGTTPLEERFIGNAFLFSEKEKKKFLKTFNPDVKFFTPTEKIYAEANANALSPMQKMQYVDMHTWIRGDILVKGDRLSMYNSHDVRVPFLDKEVFDFASKLCDGDKLSHSTTKFILRDTFRDIIDENTYMRPKLGYPVPVRVWLRNELYGWAKSIIENMTCDEYIDKKSALNMLEEHKNGTKDNYRKIWTLLVFITWYRMNVTEREKTKKRILAGEI